jgi:hypothetical protein
MKNKDVMKQTVADKLCLAVKKRISEQKRVAKLARRRQRYAEKNGGK